MNKYPTWRYFVIIAVLMLGILYALPNLYPAQPAIQVAYTDSSKSADQSLLNTIREEISNEDISISEINLKNNNIVAQFSSVEDQLVAKTIIQKALLDKVIVALKLEPTTPDWLASIGGKPLKLGLDLSGGVHFLLEVDVDTALISKIEKGDRKPTREQIEKLAVALDIDYNKLLTLWLSEKVYEDVQGEDVAIDAIKLALKRIKTEVKN